MKTHRHKGVDMAAKVLTVSGGLSILDLNLVIVPIMVFQVTILSPMERMAAANFTEIVRKFLMASHHSNGQVARKLIERHT